MAPELPVPMKPSAPTEEQVAWDTYSVSFRHHIWEVSLAVPGTAGYNPNPTGYKSGYLHASFKPGPEAAP